MRRLGYKAAIQWLLDNDDSEWLDDEHGSPSVSACLVADMYGRDTATVERDMRANLAKAEKADRDMDARIASKGAAS